MRISSEPKVLKGEMIRVKLLTTKVMEKEKQRRRSKGQNNGRIRRARIWNGENALKGLNLMQHPSRPQFRNATYGFFKHPIPYSFRLQTACFARELDLL
ncbi:hypothetical protein AAC387_Pa02g0639 [Persea americana]